MFVYYLYHCYVITSTFDKKQTIMKGPPEKRQ